MTLPSGLSRREREIMDIVFSLERATLSEILDRMEAPPTRAALRSLLTILESKGHLRHSKAGREFVYRATQEKVREGKSALRRVLEVFFGGSLEEAVATHLADPKERPSAEELAGLERLVGSARKRHPKRK